jgi:hypothetical protein
MVFFKYLLLSLLTGAALISITAAEVANPGLSAHPLAGVSHELGKRQAISCPQGFRFTSGRCAGVSLPCVFMPARATSSSSKDDGHLINEVKSITHVSYRRSRGVPGQRETVACLPLHPIFQWHDHMEIFQWHLGWDLQKCVSHCNYDLKGNVGVQ